MTAVAVDPRAGRAAGAQAAGIRWAQVADPTRCVPCHAGTTVCRPENEARLAATRTLPDGMREQARV